MGEVASAYVSLIPSAKGFGGKISSQIGGDLDSAGKTGGARLGKGVSGGFLPSIKGLMGPVAALFAVGAVVGFFKSANAEARESQKVGALTANVIKTTGGVAKITAGQVGDLSMAISNKTGVDDEAIQHGANLLLTFKNVRNEVGKGANVFDRATAAAVDLSASGFGDVAGSSKMLGKALNDPLKGITALGRAGVTFSAGQKKQIEGFVKVGDLLSAQKIIMKEVESQVGGSAAASATAGEKLTTTWGNFKETIGTALLPAIDTVMGKATEFLGFLMTNIGPAFTTVSTFLAPVIAGIKEFFTSFQTGGGPAAITGAFSGLVAFFQTQVVPAVMAIVTAIQGFVAVALPIVQEFVAGMMARIQPMLPTIMAIFAQIGVIITSALELYRAVIERVTTVIKFVWETWGGDIMSFITGVWAKIFVVIQAALNIIQGVIKTVTSIIKGDWSGAWDGIKQILSGVWDAIKGIISLALNIIGGIISAAWALIKLGVSAAWDAIKGVLVGAWNGIKSALSSALDGYKAALSAAWDAIKSVVTTVWNAIKTVISGVWDAIKSVVSGAIGAVQSAIGGLASIPGKVSGWFNSAKDGISSALSDAVSFVKGIPGKIVSALGSLGSLLYNKGKEVVQGLINGIGSMVGALANAVANAVQQGIAAMLPGSPVKKGPLRVLNRGYAGGQIVKMLAGGIDSQRASMEASMTGLVSIPRVGSLDFASSADRASAVAGGTGAGSDALLAEIQGLRADIRNLPRDYQMGARQYA